MVHLGTTRRGNRVSLSDIERSRHIHVLGATGTGKSKLLESMIRQDITLGRGLCLIDPHGRLVDAIEQWCVTSAFGRLRRIHLIKPGDRNMVPGFNPLRTVPGEDLSVRVDAMVAACAQAWGVRDMGDTPRLEKILRATFYALAARDLTLAEGPALLRARDPEGVRRLLTEGLPNPVFQITWDELNSMPRKEFAEHVESTITRLSRFLSAPAMRLVVGQRAHAIDFKTAMDKSEIVLVDLGAHTSFSYENARVLGTLLINDLFLTALGRSEEAAKRHPFTLYVDEAYDFLSGDIERILDQTRKFGLHAVLAHQRIGQLKERGEGIYNAVMGGTQTKIVLGGIADDDAAIMAREIMRDEFDLERPKKSITMPVVVDEVPFWLESESYTEGSSQSESETTSGSFGRSFGVSGAYSESFRAPEDEDPERQSVSTSIGMSWSAQEVMAAGRSVGSALSASTTRGRSQTLRSVREERPTHFYSLEENIHLAQLKLRNLPDQVAIVKRRGRRAVQVDLTEIRPTLKLPKAAERFRIRSLEHSGYLTSRAEAEKEIALRQQKLLPAPALKADDDFWQEE